MPNKKPAARKQPGRKKRAGSAFQGLINDVIRYPEVRSALYKNPKAAAKRYGLTDEEGKAMHTLKKSLLSALNRTQVQQLEGVIRMRGGWGDDGGGSTCTPDKICTPQACTPDHACPPIGGTGGGGGGSCAPLGGGPA